MNNMFNETGYKALKSLNLSRWDVIQERLLKNFMMRRE